MKFKLTDNKRLLPNGITLYQIEALKDGPWGPIGTKGGWVEKEANLSQEGNAWVYGDAQVYGDAWVSGDGKVSGDAWVYGYAKVSNSSDYMIISSLGYSNRTITITFSDKMIVAGCFRGTLEEFKTAVDKKYKGEGNYYPTIEYIMALFNLPK